MKLAALLIQPIFMIVASGWGIHVLVAEKMSNYAKTC